MRRVVRKKAPKPARIIAYDFETTKIEAGTPRPLHLTAFGQSMHYETGFDGIRDMMHLQNILINNFLTPENAGVKFVAWNGNNFDAYFLTAAMVTHPDFVMRPYLTQNNALRGVRVMRRDEYDQAGADQWEFLDGISMLGLVGVTLEKFLDTFAPDLPKLSGTINFEREQFDPSNLKHRAYALRDSEGLYHAMNRAQNILLVNFDQPLTVTMGGACIKILKSHVPEDVTVYPNSEELNTIVRTYAMRGGYCYCVKRYEGSVWKYDLNQAYASAMREANLPCGRAFYTRNGVHKFARTYIARVTAMNPRNEIPFYCRVFVNGRIRSTFADKVIPDTWLCSNEIEQLKREGWHVDIAESYAWEDVFNLKDYVDKLEYRRMNCEGGPSGPEGTIYKCVGNHSYGKLLEELPPVEYIIANECPAGFVPVYPDGDFDPLEFVYEKHLEVVHPKDYHQPHVGAFITAHVRMVVRNAALLSPTSWLYADTDCVVFSSDVTHALDIDPKRYGAWKVEESGTPFQIIAKKVYANTMTGKGSAKGLHVKKVTPAQFTEWLHGKPPVQVQVQRNNFMKVMQGAEMYRSQTRRGTATEKAV